MWQRKQRLDAKNYKTRAERCAFEVGYYEGFTCTPETKECTNYRRTAELIAHTSGFRFGITDKGQTT